VEFFADFYRQAPPAFAPPPSPPGADIPNGPRFRWRWLGGVRINDQWDLAMLFQPLGGLSDLRGTPLEAAELPRGRLRAAALGVHATLSATLAAHDPALAAAALALLAEVVTKTVDMPARRQPLPVLFASSTTTQNNVQALVNSYGYGRGLVLDDVRRTEQVHAVLAELIQVVQQRPAAAAAVEAANEGIQAALDDP
jgi:hypothetical protein